MNNNQGLNNVSPMNINSIPVVPPAQPQIQPQPVVNPQVNNTTPVQNSAVVSKNPTGTPSVQENYAINALNIGDNNNQNQVQPQPEQQKYNETSITDLNVDGQYNRMEKIPDYVNSPEVQENIHPTKKNTVTITKEMKTVLIIVGVMLAFILIMPVLFDLLNKIRFH